MSSHGTAPLNTFLFMKCRIASEFHLGGAGREMKWMKRAADLSDTRTLRALTAWVVGPNTSGLLVEAVLGIVSIL
jgi:hypothetical protein